MALVGFHQIVRHIAHADAPVIRVIAAAFAHGGAGHTAGTGAGGILALVFFQPVGDVFDIQRVVFGLDGFFDRDHVHANACAAWGHHGGNVFQRQKGHPLKKGGHFGVVGNLLFVHVKELGAAGHKHGQNVLLFAAGVLPVVFQQANAAHLIQQGLQLFGGFAGGFFQFRQGHWLAHLHFQGNIGHFVSHNAGQTPIFGVLHRQAAQLGGHTVGDHLPSFIIFSRGFVSLGILNGSLLSSSGKAVGSLMACSFYCSAHVLLRLHCFAGGPGLLCPYACHAFTCSRSQSVHSAMPSPVLAQMGMTFALGLRMAIYSRHLSISKSKYGKTSILLIRTTSHT